MSWIEAVRVHTNAEALGLMTLSPKGLGKIVTLIDLTSLDVTDTEESVALLCQKATSSLGHVAAVCVYPKFVRQVADTFEGTAINVAAVVNFPHGHSTLESVLVEMDLALQDGAQEIDVVFPYQRYLAGEKEAARSFISSCKAACGQQVILKVILETGALRDLDLIAEASLDVLMAGADFIKTSTGKTAVGATLDAAAVMLLMIKQAQAQLKKPLGLKVSGGIREIQQAAQYIALADKIMGQNWATPDTFRIGASKLVDEIEKIS